MMLGDGYGKAVGELRQRGKRSRIAAGARRQDEGPLGACDQARSISDGGAVRSKRRGRAQPGGRPASVAGGCGEDFARQAQVDGAAWLAGGNGKRAVDHGLELRT